VRFLLSVDASVETEPTENGCDFRQMKSTLNPAIPAPTIWMRLAVTRTFQDLRERCVMKIRHEPEIFIEVWKARNPVTDSN
jgi:hypothetical protein